MANKNSLLDEARVRGRNFCHTEGSIHYQASGKEENIEPMDLMIAKGLDEDFCLGSIIKYATRYKKTQNLEDLRKVSDYAQILVGSKLMKRGVEKEDDDRG